MGTGKTTAGRLAAESLGLPFFDLDQEIERRTGRPIGEIFRRDGEEAFRLIESEVVGQAARLSAAVIATGGGAVLGPGWPALAQGAVVSVLTAEPVEIANRLRGEGGRPLLQGDLDGRTRELLVRRASAYAGAGEPLDTTSHPPDQVAAELVRLYPGSREGPVRIPVGSPNGTYDLVVGRPGFERFGEEVAAALPGCPAAAVVTDPAVEPLAAAVVDRLGSAGIAPVVWKVLPPGEQAKSPAVVQELWSAFAEGGLARDGVVVAVGGGATLDAAGFAAATFNRGVALVNVPTTVLAMVDAAIGGKVAVDHSGVKNLAGAFHHPRLVVADPIALRGLPEREFRAGLAEAVKAFAIASPLALDALPRLDPHEERDLTWLVEQAVRIKAAFVSADPEDRGARHALNLGHTFAHALESATGCGIPHGEAVAIGLVAAARLGAAVGATDPALAGRLSGVLSALGLPTEPPEGLDRNALAAAMGSDKKRRYGRLRFVLPAADGVELVEGVTAEQALDALLRSVPAVRGGS